MSRVASLFDRLLGRPPEERLTVAGMEYARADLQGREDVPRVLGITVREFVEAVLVDRGGRVRQGTFTDVTDWSDSQVSRILSELEAEGVVVRTRVGRENLVSLPGEGGIDVPDWDE